MAWVRIHDGAMGNLKVLRLSAPAFRLWVRGLCYCQQHLTDGLIPREALKFLDAKRTEVDQLCSVLVPGKAPLWERIESFGFKVHDYLDWNDSRETIEAKKQAGRERVNRWRVKPDTHPPNGVSNALQHAHIASGLVSSSVDQKEERRLDPSMLDESLTERAGRFIERYEDLYQQHRKGARYLVKPHRDYEAAVGLCRTWESDERLDKIAAIFLTTDHQFAESGSRTIPQFAALASWADSRLTEWEANHAR